MGIVVNRAVYYWAYQLERYKSSAAGLVLGAVSFLWLLAATVIGLAFINVTVFNLAPDQFDGSAEPSFAAFLLYAFGTLTLGELGDVSGGGDVAYLVQLVSGLIGFVLLGIVLVNGYVVVRKSGIAPLHSDWSAN